MLQQYFTKTKQKTSSKKTEVDMWVHICVCACVLKSPLPGQRDELLDSPCRRCIWQSL